MICFLPDRTTVVVKRCSGPSIESTAAEVSSLLTEAGISAAPARWLNRALPVPTSTTEAE
jgi:hypothetical protein